MAYSFFFVSHFPKLHSNSNQRGNRTQTQSTFVESMPTSIGPVILSVFIFDVKGILTNSSKILTSSSKRNRTSGEMVNSHPEPPTAPHWNKTQAPEAGLEPAIFKLTICCITFLLLWNVPFFISSTSTFTTLIDQRETVCIKL